MKEREIQELLKAELVGKDFRGYDFDYEIYRILREKCFGALNGRTSWKKEGQSVIITYKDHTLMQVDAKKAKGKHVYRYGSSWNEWTYKDITVTVYADTLSAENDILDAIARVEKLVEQETAAKNKAELELAKQAKAMMKALGITEFTKLGYICENLSKRKYNSAFYDLVREAA